MHYSENWNSYKITLIIGSHDLQFWPEFYIQWRFYVRIFTLHSGFMLKAEKNRRVKIFIGQEEGS